MAGATESIYIDQPTDSSVAGEFQRVAEYLSQQIVGQDQLIDRLLIALVSGGHLLLEGFPGLAKTRSVKELANCVQGRFHRVQFTPDLLPADITGTEIYRPETASFQFRQGPLFHEIVLADEINRAPAKVQSALLEAMEERHVTVGDTTYPLPELFMVMATQNPIEHEGTYPLPEAQRDRFLMHVRVNYPDKNREQEILRIARSESMSETFSSAKESPQISHESILAGRSQMFNLHMSASVEKYIVELVCASRDCEVLDPQLHSWIEVGASPRGTIALDTCSRARAWFDGRDYVSPADVQSIAFDALRHRILLSYEADADGVDIDDVIRGLISAVAVP